MRHRTPLAPLLLIATVFAVFGASMPAAASAAAARRCLPVRGERTAAQSTSATLLLRGKRVLIGCSRQTGRRRVVESIEPGDPSTLQEVHLAGTRAAYVILNPDRNGAIERLFRNDAVHSRRRTLLRTGFFSDVAIGPHDVVAYVTYGAATYQLRLTGPGAGDVLVDRGAKLGGVSFSAGGRLSWQHGTTPLSTPVQLGDRCSPGNAGLDTIVLAVTRTPTSATACLRATGASSTLTADAITDVYADGTWLAAATGDGRVLTVDAQSGATGTVAAAAVTAVAVDAAGSVGWASRLDPTQAVAQIWVSDTTGSRLVDPAANDDAIDFDGSTLIWPNRSTTLAP
jgi:hypothetical protein